MILTYVVLVILHVTANGSSSWILPGASTTVNFNSGSGGTWTKKTELHAKVAINTRTAAFSCPVWILPLSPNFDLQTRSIFPTETWFCCTVDTYTTEAAEVYCKDYELSPYLVRHLNRCHGWYLIEILLTVTRWYVVLLSKYLQTLWAEETYHKNIQNNNI